jgi:hypothetical protein
MGPMQIVSVICALRKGANELIGVIALFRKKGFFF